MHRFLTLLQKDLRYFLYLEGLLMLFRVAFLVLFRSQLNAVSASEILYALYLGFRISLKTTVLLADIKDFGPMNEIYGEFFKGVCPARACFQVAALPKGALVEIEAFAVK